MTATAHALVAGAIARSIPNPIFAVPLAFASHFIMDTVPHWDIGTNWRDRPKKTTGALAIAETAFGITLAYFVFAGKVEPQLLLVTMVASELPDWLESPWYIFFARHNKHAPAARAGFWERLTYGIYRMENSFHAKAPFPLGVVTQILTVAFFLILLR
ncbi:MAG: hypothetical protein UY48_C0015G0013 [Candidatus Gottesmanbacteria bacterium GW2011_GWB1_49_7]|uniref:Uncharacterized protein n=1 Tax=Candidatus Gottesmanbacteria bacterium GW2011_GWB1_49_7 TaxID=1618448 RepID=A0A0G1Y9P2_9BACT|nr:MAG: hypothetical protein UY48_C0015G0013 [Candidatus Gottesmanbacteria bacterium GW2011_GWB1_49_7]